MKLHVVFGDSEIFEAVNDADALKYAQKQVDRIKDSDQELQVNVGSSIVILAFRILVLRGVISHDDIVFYEAKHPPTSNTIIDETTFDVKYTLNKNGKFSPRQPNIGDVYFDLLKEMVLR